MDAKKINVILDDFQTNNPKLYNHSERVAMIMYAFAQELNLPYKDREIGYFCGMLHDIGKYYLDEVEDFEEDEEYGVNEIIGGSILYFDKDFSKLIPVIGNRKHIHEEDSEKFGYNVNIIKLMLALTDKYDNLRTEGNTHEKSCEILRKDYQVNNNMVTALLKAIIKNKLNQEY